MYERQATITLTGPDNLIRHIEAIQAALTARNKTIEDLSHQLAVLRGEEPFEPTQEDLKAAFQRGYSAALRRLSDQIQGAQDIARTLGASLNKTWGEVYAHQYAAAEEGF